MEPPSGQNAGNDVIRQRANLWRLCQFLGHASQKRLGLLLHLPEMFRNAPERFASTQFLNFVPFLPIKTLFEGQMKANDLLLYVNGQEVIFQKICSPVLEFPCDRPQRASFRASPTASRREDMIFLGINDHDNRPIGYVAILVVTKLGSKVKLLCCWLLRNVKNHITQALSLLEVLTPSSILIFPGQSPKNIH